MSSDEPRAAAAYGPSADPLVIRVATGHLISAVVLTLATMALLFGKPQLALIGWAINFPASAWACAWQARRLGRGAWLGLLCSPLSPFATLVLNAIVRPRRASPERAAEVTERPPEPTGRAA